MERKDLKKALWNVIGPIDVPSGISFNFKPDGMKVSEFEDFTSRFYDPEQQQSLLFEVNNIALKFFGFDFMNALIREETDELLRSYFCEIRQKLNEYHFGVSQPDNLIEAEHDLLCHLIQIYLNDDTRPIFKRFLTVVFLFPEQVIDLKLLHSILSYYDIYNKKI